MAGFVCPNCKGESTIFPATSGGAAKMAVEMGVPYLGKIPLDPRIAQVFFDLGLIVVVWCGVAWYGGVVVARDRAGILDLGLGFDQLARISQRRAVPHATCALLFLGPAVIVF